MNRFGSGVLRFRWVGPAHGRHLLRLDRRLRVPRRGVVSAHGCRRPPHLHMHMHDLRCQQATLSNILRLPKRLQTMKIVHDRLQCVDVLLDAYINGCSGELVVKCQVSVVLALPPGSVATRRPQPRPAPYLGPHCVLHSCRRHRGRINVSAHNVNKIRAVVCSELHSARGPASPTTRTSSASAPG